MDILELQDMQPRIKDSLDGSSSVKIKQVYFFNILLTKYNQNHSTL